MATLIVADFGIANTRTIYIDVVEGQYRFISGTLTRTTVVDGDAITALERNLETITSLTGRSFLQEGGDDVFLATASSAGRALRAVLIGLMEPSLTSAMRALTGTYIDVVETLSLADMATEEQRVNTILRRRPDVIFIVGGTNDGNENLVRELIRLTELAVRLLPVEERPIVLYAGNETLKNWAKSRLEDEALTFIADNVRPTLENEALNSARLKLTQVFDDFLKKQPGGFDVISSVVKNQAIIPTAQSTANLVRYLDTLNNQGVLHIDVGSGTSTLLTSRAGRATANIRSNLGLGHSVHHVPNYIDWRDVDRWLPFPFSQERYEEWALNKALAPYTIPHTLRDQFIEMAVAREIVHLLLEEARSEWATDSRELLPHFSPIIVSGAVFTASVMPGLAALMIMDALQPAGAIDIWLDPYSLASALGAVSYLDPAAVVQVVDNSGFVRLGMAYSPEGRTRQPRASAKVKITLPAGDVIEQSVPVGSIWLPSLTPNILVNVELRLPRGMHIGGRRVIREQVRTGTAGIIVDLRGRPLRMPAGRRRRQLMGEWFTAVTGITLDDAMYEDTSDTIESSNLEEMVASVGLIEESIDFPAYDRLPDTRPDPAFAALLEDGGNDDLFGDDSLDDLAKGLGLR